LDSYGFGAPSLAAHSAPDEVAKSIVNDYVNALLGVNSDCRPGIWVEEQVFRDSTDAAKKLINEIAARNVAQQKWFFSLVNLADAEFGKHHQAQSISDLQKLAASQLNLKDRPWMLSLDQLSINNCPMCYNPVNVSAIICGTCRYVLKPDQYHPEKFAVETKVAS
jgi:hypothetical protein